MLTVKVYRKKNGFVAVAEGVGEATGTTFDSAICNFMSEIYFCNDIVEFLLVDEDNDMEKQKKAIKKNTRKKR